MDDPTPPSERLNKFLALQLGISRREADALIEKGRVTVNGSRAVLGGRLGSNDRIAVDGALINTDTRHQYLLLHKPVGYVCSRRQQGDTPTIYSILPPEFHHLKPVGRLDKDSSGLILLTNDGDFAHRMTHPSFHKTKVYEATLDVPLQPLHQQMISDFGVMLEDGKSQFLVERVESVLSPLLEEDVPVRASQTPQDDQRSPVEWPPKKDGGSTGERNNSYKITMSEGRNRQIRRTFAALGYTVTRLHRITFGNYSLGDIASGRYQSIDMR